MLQYQLAAALYQEVAMLNEFIKQADSKRESRAYVVRLNLQAMMYAQNPPVDLYTTLSLFAGDYAVDPKESGDGLGKHRVKVIPMLVTDSIESAMRSRSRREIVDFAASIAGGVGSVGGSAGLNRRYDQILSALGRSFNSTYQIIRSTDNTIRVKLGAAYQILDDQGRFPKDGGSDLGLISRTAPITLLVVVEKTDGYEESWPASLSVFARTSYRDPRTGRVRESSIDMPRRFHRIRQTELYRVYGLKSTMDALAQDAFSNRRDSGPINSTLGTLARHVSENRFKEFTETLEKFRTARGINSGEVDLGPLLWTLLAENFSDLEASFTTISLDNQRVPDLKALLPKTRPALLDDGKSLRVTISNGKFLDESSLTATLVIPNSQEYTRFQATKLSSRNGGAVVDIEFPWIDPKTISTKHTATGYWLSLSYFDKREEQYQEAELDEGFSIWTKKLRTPKKKTVSLLSEIKAHPMSIQYRALAGALRAKRSTKTEPQPDSFQSLVDRIYSDPPDDDKGVEAKRNEARHKISAFGTIPLRRVSTAKLDPTAAIKVAVVGGPITINNGLLRLSFSSNPKIPVTPKRIEIRVSGGLPHKLEGPNKHDFKIASDRVIAKNAAGLYRKIKESEKPTTSLAPESRSPVEANVYLKNLQTSQPITVKLYVDGKEISTETVKIVEGSSSKTSGSSSSGNNSGSRSRGSGSRVSRSQESGSNCCESSCCRSSCCRSSCCGSSCCGACGKKG